MRRGWPSKRQTDAEVRTRGAKRDPAADDATPARPTPARPTPASGSAAGAEPVDAGASHQVRRRLREPAAEVELSAGPAGEQPDRPGIGCHRDRALRPVRLS